MNLQDLGNGDSINPYKDQPEAKAKENELVETFKTNQSIERELKIEYERLLSKVTSC